MASKQVFEGFWRDWTRGAVAGATLTVDSRTGAYFVAFLALFVHYAGLSCWRLFSYCIFQKRASPSLKDECRIKEQIVLRNSASPSNALQNFAKLAKADRTHFTWYLAVVAALNLALLTIAGIFSSKVTAAESNVLLLPITCGRWDAFSFPEAVNYSGPIIEFINWQAASTETWTLSNDYASACSDANSIKGICPALAPQSPQVNFSTTTDCLFGPSMCRENSTVLLDSNYIDSHLHLGINSPAEDRIGAHLQTQCSPIQMDGYRFTYDKTNVSAIASNLYTFNDTSLTESLCPWYVFEYGASVEMNDSVTYSVSGSQDGLVWEYGGSEGTSITYLFAFEVYEECSATSPGCASSFDAIPNLRIPNRDTSLIFLTNLVQYSGPVTDPWFEAQVPESFGWQGYDNSSTLYSSSEMTTVLGCTHSIQICRQPYSDPSSCVRVNSAGFPCGPNGTFGNITDMLDLSQKQTSIATRVQDAIFRSAMWDLATSIGPQTLLAMHEVNGNTSPPLPANQWMLEMQNWFSLMITNMQVYSMQYVTGFEANAVSQQQADTWSRSINYPSPEDSWMCHNQIVQSTEFASFSVLGLAIIFIVGGLLILLDISIVCLVNRVRSNTPQNRYRKEAWDTFALIELKHVDKGSDEEDSTQSVSSSSSENFPGKNGAQVAVQSTHDPSLSSVNTDEANGGRQSEGDGNGVDSYSDNQDRVSSDLELSIHEPSRPHEANQDTMAIAETSNYECARSA